MTEDGSHSIETEGGQTYHSTRGAIQESMHVYIQEGLRQLPAGKDPIHIFEMGMGTGLNVLLTLLAAEQMQRDIFYETVELKPLDESLIPSLNYCEQLGVPGHSSLFEQIHDCAWDIPVQTGSRFTFYKTRRDVVGYSLQQPANLVYYDAFAPAVQPELWSGEIFKKLFSQLLPGALLVTYSSSGAVRRALQAAGFSVEKIPGPPGKREITRAIKGGSRSGAK